jgi:hypothetical protein
MGNRRVSEPLSAVPLSSAQARGAFAEDDAMLTCPECGAGVRPDQEWCTLCLHVLRVPEPPAALAAPVAPVAPVVAAAVLPASATAAPGEGSVPKAPLSPDVEATADAMLAQLAVATHQERLVVPSFLDTKAKVAVSIGVGMCVLSAAVLLILTVLGAVLR